MDFFFGAGGGGWANKPGCETTTGKKKTGPADNLNFRPTPQKGRGLGPCRGPPVAASPGFPGMGRAVGAPWGGAGASKGGGKLQIPQLICFFVFGGEWAVVFFSEGGGTPPEKKKTKGKVKNGKKVKAARGGFGGTATHFNWNGGSSPQACLVVFFNCKKV